ncbi:TonB-dependent receptor plug domain-containing protein [Pasteurella atlantica]|uniref:TonB-dependent receptor plug domain-containing protein n=2 Tax=Pasteurellaceae TaxID=712 RepID=A0ACC6HJ68_9PAST|nr:TonB-dependent receptor plug domain-containing protein [Pasteurella atlantica]MDP8050915.1 TonB-dependent receptor plug domain-containing protein [Pasteurella atlantica]MDP8104185.1 TonB-dependent receptor plug domain-containing protein [Pasteurella atlantica]MDP8147571.1 TonB-dependent receptor plug domain-containing protein [Pasteurella atlantica]
MKKLHKSIILTSTVAVALPVYADNVEQSTINNQQSTINNQQLVENKLSEVVVYGQQNTGLSSTQKITSKEIAKTPVSNGNISDYLKSDPHVRFENSDESNLVRGEIKPAEISINGAEPSQTSYYIDNVNINNDLGTASNGLFDGSMATIPQVQSGQAYFFDANLLSSVVIHDSDVSATLGGFSGGAVVAKTKYYDGTDRVKLRYRTSRSQWTEFNIDEKLRNTFEEAKPKGATAFYQPKYDKYFFSLSAEKSLTDDLGVVFGISRRASDIKQARLISNKETANQNHTRRSDNALVNFNYSSSDNDRFELGLRYSKYREGKFFDVNINSDLYDYHNAYGTTLAWIHSLDSGVLTSTLAYDKFKDQRHSNATHLERTISKKMDSSYNVSTITFEKGGMGDSTLKQQNIHYSMEYAINPFELGKTNHSFSIGGLYQFTKYDFNRKQDVSGTIIQENDMSILGIPIERTERHYSSKKGNVKAKYQNLSLYAEDLIKVGNFEFRPGIRFERDDYLKNTNIAPRFVTRWSPLETTSVSLGLNRYYGRSFAAMKLTEEVFKLDGHDNFRYHDIKSFETPYSDEISLGLNQQFGNFMFNAKFIHRDNKNRIVLREDISTHPFKKEYKKGPDYGVDVYTLQVNNLEPWKLGKTYWNTSLAFNLLKSDFIDNERVLTTDEVVFKGKVMSYGEMQSKVNNSKEDWTISLGVDMAVPDYDLTWTNKVFIKAPIKGFKNTRTWDAKDRTIYTSYDYGTHTQWDTSIRWAPKFGKHSPYIKFDILNVLNKTRRNLNDLALTNPDPYGDAINTSLYSAGREFWLELGYEF